MCSTGGVGPDRVAHCILCTWHPARPVAREQRRQPKTNAILIWVAVRSSWTRSARRTRNRTELLMKTKNSWPNDKQRKRASIDELEEALRLEAMDVLLTAW